MVEISFECAKRKVGTGADGSEGGSVAAPSDDGEPSSMIAPPPAEKELVAESVDATECGGGRAVAATASVARVTELAASSASWTRRDNWGLARIAAALLRRPRRHLPAAGAAGAVVAVAAALIGAERRTMRGERETLGRQAGRRRRSWNPLCNASRRRSRRRRAAAGATKRPRRAGTKAVRACGGKHEQGARAAGAAQAGSEERGGGDVLGRSLLM
ncbi:hypothetical protein FGB62_25g525 [Gracilaria domingensis]|nr:hypothetical protein FGB62_25g525 [Gracilaria domingensis]